jgi:hypothetical protein
LPLQHLPVPGVHVTRVCLSLFVALSGFDYPLSGLLLRVLRIHLSGPSVLGVFPFRVLFPLASCVPFQDRCSPALSLFGSGHDHEPAGTPEPCSRQRACLALPVVTPTTESLLSWGSAPLRPYSFDPADRRRLLFCALNPCLPTPIRRSRVFLPKARLVSIRNSPTPLMFSPTQPFLRKPFRL